MFLNGRWLGSDQKVGVGTKYSRPEGLSVSRADYRTSLMIEIDWIDFQSLQIVKCER